jgi:hypothetical protein
MSVHRRDSQKPGNQNNKLYKHMNTIGWDNADIVLVQNVRCNSRDELLKVENTYIIGAWGDDLCLNGKVSYRNPEDRPVLERTQCQCGATYLNINQKRHLLTARHRDGVTPSPTAEPAPEPTPEATQ